MPQTETLEDILKILDAQRPTEAPPASTRVDQPEGYLENGEWVEPNQGPDSTWLGEMVSESKYLPVPAHGDEERYRKVVKDQLDLWVPQTAPMVGLTVAAGPLLKGAVKLGAPLIKPIKSVVNKVKDLYYKSRGMMAEKEVVNLTRTLQEISERASIQRPLDTPVVDFLQSRPQTTTVPSMTVTPGMQTGRALADDLAEAAIPPRPAESYADVARHHQERFNRQTAMEYQEVTRGQGNLVGRNLDEMSDAQFGEEFGNIADDFMDDIQPRPEDLGHPYTPPQGMEEVAPGLLRVADDIPVPKGQPTVYKMNRGQGSKGIPKIEVAQEKGVFNRIEFPSTTSRGVTKPGKVLIEHTTPVGPGKMRHSYRLQDPDIFRKVMKKNPDLRWTKGPNKTTVQKEMNEQIRQLIAKEDLSKMTFFTDVLPANPQIIGSKPLVQIKGLNFYTGTRNVKIEGEWVKQMIGHRNDSGKIMASIFDRFPDNWIITTKGRANTFSLDSIRNMIGGVLKRADEMKFHSGTGRSSYTSLAVSEESAFSKQILKATTPEGRVKATQKTMDDIMKQLDKASETSEVIGSPDIKAGVGSVKMKHFTIRHMKEVLSGVFLLSVKDMGKLLHDMDGIPDSKLWEDEIMSGEEYF